MSENNKNNNEQSIQMDVYGTNFSKDGSIIFNFWAPDAKEVVLCINNQGQKQEFEMQEEDNKHFKYALKDLKSGSLYGYKVDGNLVVPDPASRYQPDGVHGVSELLNPFEFNWEQDSSWKGMDFKDAIFYELNVGTFTEKGTFLSAIEKLDYLVELGITAIELMPLGEFSGDRNWGYDGVLLYAPDSCYGRPEDLKEFIKQAHKRGVMVFLDVVYNHLGPDGNYLYTYAKSQFFNHDIKTPWGDAINFKNKNVREFIITNSIYWLDEFHFDGLRLDAIHAISDDSVPDVIEELTQRVSHYFKGERKVHIVVENDDNEVKYLGGAESGRAQAQWNDDVHHCLHLLATNEKDGYYNDYTQEFSKHPTSYHLARALTQGYSYQGESSHYRGGEQRGDNSSHLPLYSFVNFIQNHDQVGNRALGERISLLTDAKSLMAIAFINLLAPSVPLLFMGEEWGAKTPFYFFCDFKGNLASSIRDGRRREFSRFEQFKDPKNQELIPDPCALKTFEDSKLNWAELNEESHARIFNFYKSLIKTRKKEVIPILNKIIKKEFEVMGEKSFCCSWELENEYLILIANFEDAKIYLRNKNINEKSVLAISDFESKEEFLTTGILKPKTALLCRLTKGN